MKSFSFIHLLIAVFFCGLISCQKTDITVHQIDDYFPLEVGNFWVYKNYNGHTYTYKIDSMVKIDGKDYYRMIKSTSDTAFYRKDPFWKVYERRRNTAEVIKYNFGVPEGYKWSYDVDPYHAVPAYQGKAWTVTLGSKTDTVKSNHETFNNCYEYGFDIPSIADEEFMFSLAPGTGIVKSWNMWNSPLRLIKAQINGEVKEY